MPPLDIEVAIAAVGMASFFNDIGRYSMTRVGWGVAIGVMFASCTPSGGLIQSGWTTYRNSRFDFEFLYPQDWIALPPPTNQDGRAFQHPEKPDIEIRGWGRLKLIGSNAPDGVALDTPEPEDYNFTTEQGLPAVLEVEVGKEESTMTMTLESGDVIYQWQGRSPKDKFAKYYEVFYYIAQHYRVATPPKEP